MAFVRVRNRQTGEQKVFAVGMAQALRDKYEIITQEEKTDDETPNLKAQPEVSEKKTAVAANEPHVTEVTFEKEQEQPKVEGKSDEPNIEDLRAKYQELYGNAPDGRLKASSLIKFINEKQSQNA